LLLSLQLGSIQQVPSQSSLTSLFDLQNFFVLLPLKKAQSRPPLSAGLPGVVGDGVGATVYTGTGFSVAGSSVAGSSVFGSSVPGSSVFGSSVFGSSVCGSSVGASVAGASVAGAGASVAGVAQE